MVKVYYWRKIAIMLIAISVEWTVETPSMSATWQSAVTMQNKM